MQDPGLDIESSVCDVIFYEGVFFWMIFLHLPVASFYRLIIELIIQLASVTEVQSQTKIVGTLPFNAVFLPSCPFPLPPNVVYRS